MGERAVLQIEIDANGVITGSQKSVRSIDEIKRSAGGLDKTVASASASLAKFGAVAALAAVAVGVVALRGLVGVMADVVKEASDDANALAQLQAVVKSTGGAAGLSAQEMSDLGGSLQLVSKFGDDSIASMQAVLATFTSIRGPAFTETTTAILDMATALGLDLQQAAIQVGKSINDPVKGLQLLGRVGVSFTDGQKDLVKQLVETGDTLGAQRVILAELNKEFGGSAAASVGTYTGQIDQLNKRWEIFKEIIGQRLLPILTNLVTQLVTLASNHSELGVQVAGVIVYLTRFSLLLASLTVTGVELALVIGVKLNRAYSMLADTLAGLTIGETSRALAEASRNAAANADLMESVAGASGDVAVALLKVAVGMGEVDAKGEPTRAAITGVGDAAGQSAAEAKAFADSLQGIVDEVDPTGKKVRELFEKIEILQQAIATGSADRLPTYIAALRDLQAQLHAIATEADLTAQTLETLPVNRTVTEIREPLLPQQATMTMTQNGVSEYERDMDAANERLAAGLKDSFTGALTGAIMTFATGGKDAAKQFGQAIKAALLDAAAQYLKAMLDAAMKAAMAQRTGSAAGAYGPTQAGGNIASSAGGMSAMGGGMSTAGSVMMAAAVAYAVIEITKAIRAANDAGKFKETAVAGVYRGGIGSTYAGELSEQGRQMAASMRDFLNLMQSVAGEWITSLPEIGVRVSGDGKKFQAMVGGEIIGTFKSMSEAMARSFQAAFSQASFSSAVDPIIRDMVANFRGNNIDELKAGLIKVREMLDEVAGLSQVEIAIRDLPFKADALKQSMVQLGASFEDASALAAKWQAVQMMNLRDQITGHQATVAEQRAQKEREALMFNAQLLVNKSEIDMKRAKLRADIEILRAGGSLATADLNISTQYLGQVGRLTEVKAELLNQDLQIQQGHVNLMTAAGQAALAALELQLAALDQVYEILDSIKPINLGEIRIPGHGGGGSGNVDTGPTEAEQRAADFAAFIREQMASGLSDLQQRLRALDEAFAAQALAASEVEGGEAALAAARKAAIDALNEDLIDGLGSPTEALRDRFADMREAIDQIRSSAERGSDTLDHLNEVLNELGMQASVEVLSLAADIADAFGMDKQAAAFRAQVAELDLRLKIIQLQLLYKEYQALGMIDAALEATFKEFFLFIGDPANWPDFTPPEPPPPPRDTSGADAMEEARKRREQLLTQALDRLRNALDDYRAFQEDLLIGPLSGATLQQQAANAQTEYERLLALAQAGNLDAIEALPAAARQYLELAGEFLDPSSAGYQQILSLVQGQMAGVQQTIEDVLNSVPAQMAGVEDRLDTIAELLAIIAGVDASTPGTPANHAGMVYYGEQYGWHWPGWAPSGGGGGDLGENFSRSAAVRFSANGDPSRNVIAAKFSNASVVKVHDEETQRSIARLEAKLERIEAAQVVDTSKAERHRRQQAPRGAKRVGGAYRDEVAG